MKTGERTEEKPKNAKFFKMLFLIIGILAILAGIYLAFTDQYLIGAGGIGSGSLIVYGTFNHKEGDKKE